MGCTISRETDGPDTAHANQSTANPTSERAAGKRSANPVPSFQLQQLNQMRAPQRARSESAPVPPEIEKERKENRALEQDTRQQVGRLVPKYFKDELKARDVTDAQKDVMAWAVYRHLATRPGPGAEKRIAGPMVGKEGFTFGKSRSGDAAEDHDIAPDAKP